MSATNNESNRGSPSFYRPEANAWISKRSSDLDYKGVFCLDKNWFSTVLVLRGHVEQSTVVSECRLGKIILNWDLKLFHLTLNFFCHFIK